MTYRGDAKGAETKHNAKSTRAEVQKIRFAINFHCTSANESQNPTMLGALTVELAKDMYVATEVVSKSIDIITINTTILLLIEKTIRLAVIVPV